MGWGHGTPLQYEIGNTSALQQADGGIAPPPASPFRRHSRPNRPDRKSVIAFWISASLFITKGP